MDWGKVREDVLGVIQARYIYCPLYLYYCISSTSGPQALDRGRWNPCSKSGFASQASQIMGAPSVLRGSRWMDLSVPEATAQQAAPRGLWTSPVCFLVMFTVDTFTVWMSLSTNNCSLRGCTLMLRSSRETLCVDYHVRPFCKSGRTGVIYASSVASLTEERGGKIVCDTPQGVPIASGNPGLLTFSLECSLSFLLFGADAFLSTHMWKLVENS